MITASITVSPSNPREITVEVLAPLKNPRALNAVLAQRLANEIKDHFRLKNAEPNKRGWSKTNFWSQLGRATAVDKDSVSDTGATVVVADARYRVHLFGGTIRPTGGRKFLTIPLVVEARGLNPASYERKTKRELFRLPGTRVLVEQRSRGGDRSLVNATTGRRFRDGTASAVQVGARQQLRAVYALAREAKIKADPAALPDTAKLIAALNEEADAYLVRLATRQGGAA